MALVGGQGAPSGRGGGATRFRESSPLTPFVQLKTVDDVVYEADCSMITLRQGEVNIGANA